ncbi:hypothetical protein J26TS2_40670 [Shouchella clausii]|nr:hypothetical protein J26TS2_40670 [Shouchella clausii]
MFYIGKDAKQLLMDKGALVTMLFMPLVLILILGFALGDTFTGMPEKIDVGVVSDETLADAIQHFSNELDDWPAQEKTAVLGLAEQLSVPELLIETVESTEDLDSITFHYENELSAARDKDYAGVLYIGEGSRAQIWEQQFLGGGESTGAFTFYANANEPQQAAIVEAIMKQFIDQFYAQTALANAGLESSMLEGIGDVIYQGNQPISAFEYYMFAMGVMFVFYTAGFMASHAYMEKKTSVYARLILANVSQAGYLVGKGVTTVLLVLIQLALIFAVNLALFRIEIGNWPAVLLISLMLGIAVASVALLITAIQFRFRSEKIANLFMFFILTILAFVGGSFFPVSDLSPLLAQLSQWTPNGRALTAFLQAAQGAALEEVRPAILMLSGFSCLCFAIAWLFFPRQGGAES